MTQPKPSHSGAARDAWLRALQNTAAIEREPQVTFPIAIERLAQRFGPASALESSAASMSYEALAARCHQYARWGLAQGLRAGDVAALVMSNCPEYLAVWVGLSRIGMTVALVNAQLTGDPLAHAIRIANPCVIVAGAELTAGIEAIRSRLDPAIAYWALEAGAGDFAPLESALAGMTEESLQAHECALPLLDATALYIYTSGTTGLPKAAKVSHYRVMQWSHWFAGMMDTRREDRMYNCLPLYHSVGGIVACGATLVAGGTVVIRKRFSAAEFWRDVAAQRCTLFQYIGELCRYLVNAPRQAIDTGHGLRLACGNGLRPEVWQAFKTRFGIPRILEYYASTEGNFSLYNCEEEVGAIGRIPAYLAARLPVALLRFDVERGEPLRNDAGFCERCAPGEVGEAAGLIPQTAARGGRFEGYEDAAASARKMLHDVFIAGDVWYRTGDLMRRDDRGYYYFVDRVGETYRWKGENVSTTEVSTALAACPGVSQAVVYGVIVPGAEGRAGMAALVVDDKFDLVSFRDSVARSLPSFARPVFLRLSSALEATSTFKTKKQDLIGEGFDPAAVTDAIYLDDPRRKAYVRIDEDVHDDLCNAVVRL